MESQPLATQLQTGSTWLTCIECGGQFEASLRDPRLRCPHCAAVGYADRAGRNLLPISWDCAECGHHNDGLANFCVACGAGLASRCLRCEAPVYSAVCQVCGSHQARLIRLQTLEAERAEWIPILQSYLPPVQPSVAPAQAPAPQPAAPAAMPVAKPAAPQPQWANDWTMVDQQMQQAAQRRAARHARRRAHRMGRSSRHRSGWRWWWNPWLIFGLIWLLSSASRDVAGAFSLVRLPDAVQSWWSNAAQGFTTLDPSAPNYVVVFFVVTFGLALLPILLYSIYRAAQRLFQG